ncbi:MAG TPA: sulfatase-like hydrolase/transferase [bacterium]|nr:sulfatase-like hydrolase/transferase [bacterium]HPN42789.1 sulfatase-like hydrolase/transferase [bacterium]
MNPSHPDRREFLKSLGVVSAALVIPGCATLGKKRPNILWLTCEDTSPALGCYGDAYANTPNIDKVAAQGIVYRNAFTTAPICAPSRSCLITGRYATSLGTQHLRSEIPVPADLKILPEYLREAGYFCTNNSKTDYNFSPDERWNENSATAHWRNRPAGLPFFSVFNYTITHEGNANNSNDQVLAGLTERHDPARAALPPNYPDTPEMRRICARQYDLVTAWDQQVGERLKELEDDGLLEDTIIFIFSDHGFGLPRYKRWLYDTGLHVPLVIRIPGKFHHLAKTHAGHENTDLVSFVDFAPSVLQLAGQPIPAVMEGAPFLGRKTPPARQFIFGARDRADDVFDVSRCVRSERYIYIRNFIPHLPYIQNALIFGDQKTAFRELRRVRNTEGLPPGGEAMWQHKPLEELYDLQNDPNELHNLASSPDYADIKETLKTRLFDWILQTRDSGFLIEAEMMIRAQGSSVYAMTHDPKQYDLEAILDTAKLVGDPSVPLDELQKRLQSPDSGVRFWAATAFLAMCEAAAPVLIEIKSLLDDPSPAVQIVCAEILCHHNQCRAGLPVLMRNLEDSARPTVVLFAAASLRNIGIMAKPHLAAIKEIQKQYLGKAGGRYKDWLYPMFIGFALDQVRINCGEKIDIRE